MQNVSSSSTLERTDRIGIALARNNHSLLPALGAAIGGELSDEIADLAERVQQSTVLIYRGGGNGAGIIWRSDGQIITNNHVVNPGGRAEVVLADGRKLVGIVAARHPTRDLAIIKVAATDLPAIPVADSRRVKAGQIVIAVGHPLGLRDAVTMGILAYGANDPNDEDSKDSDHLRADLWIRPGSSGGPMVDHTGAVLGVNTLVSGSVAMAIPSHAVEQFVNDHDVQSGSGMGFGGLVIALPHGEYETGYLVSQVVPGSDAEHSGLIVGDIIVQIGQMPIVNSEALVDSIRTETSRDGVIWQVIRAGDLRQLNVTSPSAG